MLHKVLSAVVLTVIVLAQAVVSVPQAGPILCGVDLPPCPIAQDCCSGLIPTPPATTGFCAGECPL
ncbi:hypothetical protein B0H17DRAFT_577291 [Mycena rosella]|uniref:Uncharacterized protein n=1 Tax=Mycena rosella TaxID=1033263 RepID=A0AAD7GIU3_MYCRO|nr:hypothetical protein B0H17DRAFT_577291 [Mycena rosella]